MLKTNRLIDSPEFLTYVYISLSHRNERYLNYFRSDGLRASYRLAVGKSDASSALPAVSKSASNAKHKPSVVDEDDQDEDDADKTRTAKA